ncbi:MAG: adenylate/guanylate cyclase domain-containing protein [Myxococcota bacterium]|nr:adenylate/guanylate cyclase domain-containing protein [Myxococcota bacterium]
MRSLQVKFSALVVALLVVASVGLAWMATRHERGALEAEVHKRGVALATNLAGDAKVPLLEGDELALGTLVQHAGDEPGVVAARLLGAEGRVVASLEPAEVGATASPLAVGAEVATARRGPRLLLGAPVVYSDVRVGEAQIELDLAALVDPVVADSQRQLAWVAGAVLLLGVGGGLAFVALLVGPIRRLRAGVERLTAGDLATRVPPTSRDEVGELTRAFNKMGESLQQKERIQRAFGRYASDYVLNRLLESPEGADMAGAEREVTILFCDVRRFTRLSEGLEARDVVALLNEIFQIVSDRILARGGTIDKFIGDSVMAYFGAPVPSADHALEAVNAAIDIARAIDERNARVGEGGHRVDVGVGIHTGKVVVGNIGSERRADFTAIGDAVNVAHRLEKLARPAEILVSEAVQRRVRGSVKLRFEGERQLSGRVEPVHVYAVEMPAPAAPLAAAAGSSP